MTDGRTDRKAWLLKIEFLILISDFFYEIMVIITLFTNSRIIVRLAAVMALLINIYRIVLWTAFRGYQNYKIKTSFVSLDGPKILLLIFVEYCLLYDAIYNFSVWLRIGSDSADIDRFRSYTEIYLP